MASNLLRAHISKLALEDSGLSFLRTIGSFGNTKVNDLQFAFIGDQNVLRRNIPMNNVEFPSPRVLLSMGMIETLTDLRSNVDRLSRGHELRSFSVSLHHGTQIPPCNIFHRNVIGVARLS